MLCNCKLCYFYDRLPTNEYLGENIPLVTADCRTRRETRDDEKELNKSQCDARISEFLPETAKSTNLSSFTVQKLSLSFTQGDRWQAQGPVIRSAASTEAGFFDM